MINFTTPQAEKTCSHCGKKFRASSKARYCSDACKMKAYRLRVKRKAETVTNKGNGVES